MSVSFRISWLCLSIPMLICLSGLSAIEPRRDARGNANETAERLGLFTAIEQSKLEVDFIASSASKAKVIIRNKTNQPLEIALPRTFAAVPVQPQINPLGNNPFGNAQIGQGQFGNGLAGGQGLGNGGLGNQGSQGLGGGFQQGQGNGFGNAGNFQGQFGGGQPGFGRGGGMFRIDPEKARKIDVATVCLEHGKPDPHPRMKYRIIPLDNFITDPRLEELCSQLAGGAITQNAAQAAAWHMANNLSWSNLAAKIKKISKYTGNENFFSQDELKSAQRFVLSVQPLEKVDVSPSATGETGR